MNLSILDIETGKLLPARISQLLSSEVPLKKDGWKFLWKELIQVEGSHLFKLTLDDSPEKIEGIAMFSIYFEEMVYMNNLEVAPQNIGKNKKYDHIAGGLIAFGCRFGLEYGKGGYHGYLTFESKTKLIPLYQEKYGAIHVGGSKMYIDPIQGEKLISIYLKPKERNND